MSKFCPKCGRENLDDAGFCANCGYDFKDLNDVLKKESASDKKDKGKNPIPFGIKDILILVLVIVIISLLSMSILGVNYWADGQDQQITLDNGLSTDDVDLNYSSSDKDAIKTHEFNYGNKASFNISDSLTTKTGVNSILFGQGVSYKYKDGSVCFIGGLVAIGGSDELEYRQNDAYTEEVGKYSTSQGYDGYIFKYDGIETYDVLIDLNNMTIVESGGFEEEFSYFSASFNSLYESKVFIDTFKLNESAIKK